MHKLEKLFEMFSFSYHFFEPCFLCFDGVFLQSESFGCVFLTSLPSFSPCITGNDRAVSGEAELLFSFTSKARSIGLGLLRCPLPFLDLCGAIPLKEQVEFCVASAGRGRRLFCLIERPKSTFLRFSASARNARSSTGTERTSPCSMHLGPVQISMVCETTNS